MLQPGCPAAHCVEQLHFGGGTPTYLTNEQFTEVFEHLEANVQPARVTDERDFSIEIDPRTVDPARIAFLTGLGINRMSLGIQDFDPDVQLAVNRLQSEADTAAIIDAARDNGIKSLSVDLIYGLPQQTLDRFSPNARARIVHLSRRIGSLCTATRTSPPGSKPSGRSKPSSCRTRRPS